jgi:hypothetical protein
MLAFLAPGPRFSLFSIASIPSTPSSSHIWKHLVRVLKRRRVESSSCTTSLKYRRHEQRLDKAYLFSLSGNFCCLISLLSIGVAVPSINVFTLSSESSEKDRADESAMKKIVE